MQPTFPAVDWLALMSAQLQQRWPTIDPQRLDDLALDLSRDSALRAMSPERIAAVWLEPVARDGR